MQPMIFDLPDHFMLSVFKLINFKQRLNLACVCKKWHQYYCDASLWKTIDLKNYKNKLNLLQLKQIIKLYGTDALNLLSITGNYDYSNTQKSTTILIDKEDDDNDSLDDDDDDDDELNDCQNNNEKLKPLYYLDKSFLCLLSNKCRNIETILFEYLDLIKLKNLYILLSNNDNLKHLTLRWCNLTSIKLQDELNFSSLNLIEMKNLHTLNLIRINNTFSKHDIQLICNLMPNLTNLTINESKSSFTDDCIIPILNLFKLEKLELINTLISDMAIIELTKSIHLKSNLNYLNLSMNLKLSNLCLELIGNNFQKLNHLYLTSCFGLTNIIYIENLFNLKYLNINNTSIEKKFILDFIDKLPACEVEYQHEKILMRKFNWTINGSKNCVCSF